MLAYSRVLQKERIGEGQGQCRRSSIDLSLLKVQSVPAPDKGTKNVTANTVVGTRAFMSWAEMYNRGLPAAPAAKFKKQFEHTHRTDAREQTTRTALSARRTQI